jgi:ketosteroid isomerase-like protein
MSHTTLEGTDTVATLHRLNAEYMRAVAEADTAWYDENLSDDFVCTLADGRRIDRESFLRRTAEGTGVTEVGYDEIDVRLLGDVALVHGVSHYRIAGVHASTRYTDVWHLRAGRWLAVAAQLTRIARP